MQGLDLRVAQAIAAELGRPLKIVPFESKYEGDSSLASEVNALFGLLKHWPGLLTHGARWCGKVDRVVPAGAAIALAIASPAHQGPTIG